MPPIPDALTDIKAKPTDVMALQWTEQLRQAYLDCADSVVRDKSYQDNFNRTVDTFNKESRTNK